MGEIQTITADRLPYLTFVPQDGRSIPVMAYLDPSHNWSLFVQRDGSFMIYHPIGAMSTTFITSNLVLSPIDCCLPLSDFVFQYTSFDDTLQTIKAIEDDFSKFLSVNPQVLCPAKLC